MNTRTPAARRLLASAWVAAAALASLLAASAHATDESTRIRRFESSLLPGLQMEGEPEQRWTLQERMAHWKVPGMSVAVIRDGKVAWAKGYGVLQAGKPDLVDTRTVFSAGSVSKVGAAATTLRLVDAGKLDLDADVNRYLTRWKVPKDFYTAIRPVTLRGILSHSAGLSVHGFPDFQPGEVLPDVIDTLEGRSPARTDPVRVEYLPGSRFQYSGGGIMLEQLIVEEVTGLSFPQAARQYLFQPLGMVRSTYENPIPESYANIAKAHGPDGEPRALPRGYEAMPEMAASGLWTTPGDYAKLVIAFIESYQGKPGSFLSRDLAQQVLTEVWPSQVGLGPFLEGVGMDRRFFHDGANDSYKAHMEGHPGTGNGVVILTNGTNGSRLIPEVVRAVAVAEGWSPALANHARIRAEKLSPADLQEFAGIYAESREDGIRRLIIYKDGSLYMSDSIGSDGFRLIPLGAARFAYEAEGKQKQVRFLRDYDGQIRGMLREQKLGMVKLDKILSRPRQDGQ